MTQGVGTTSASGEADLPSPQERRRLRESAELTHGEVAAAVGVSPATVRSWENGRTQPRGRKRKAYARFLTRLAASADPAEPAAPAPAAGPPDTATPRAQTSATRAPAADAPAAHAPDTPKGSGPGAVRVSPAPARPVGSRKRPKVAAKRAPKPPAGSSRHDGKTPGKAAGSNHIPLPPEPPEPRPEPQPRPPAPQAPTNPAPAPGSDTPTATAEPDATAEPTATPESDAVAEPEAPVDSGPLTPAQVYDALYAYAAPALVRQAYLLTGRRSLALEAVEKAFLQAWARWPEVATDPDPVGWVRAASYEYALSPWHRFRRAFRHPDKAPAEAADRITMDALLALPTAYRRAVLLYDGVGLDLPDTAAEIEASTPTAGLRLLNAHAALVARIPELAALPPAQRSARLRERMGSVRPAVSLEPRPAAAVRTSCERRSRALSRAALGLTAVIAVATAYTATTAPTQYIPPLAPGSSVSGVPPLSGPQRFTEQSKELHDRLRSEPAAGPARLAPKSE
ncbi:MULTISPECIES: helix-turn-helix domain-containing protein [unclassified Streptomyces]|uniref:helix-turn-helix domain-containing protein n=1 Tax=unclassified Streptomyces TaxID=2593676 RepID=UPI002E363214|nr:MULTISPECIES: helix-turn-helix domain-containing protein [unclassified Streptomyces]WUC65001.1 helix-turn-helix domain-containing protein [Streptomyces sp. NBC_00539]